MALRRCYKSAGENLGVRNDVCRPIEGVATVIDSAAASGLVVYSTQKLPFGGTHLGTRHGRAWWVIEEKADD